MPNRCPQCGFEFAWDGKSCGHCSYPSIKRTNDPSDSESDTGLMGDLGRYSNELYTKGDLKAGLRLLVEIAGYGSVAVFTVAAITIWLPMVGITLSGAVGAKILTEVMKAYASMSREQRKQIRAAVRYIKGGMSLGDRLID